jgi:dTDP-glucose 4,6-dehydratase
VDLTRPISEGIIKECANVDYVLHMAAETHVDRSIQDPGPFIYSNVVGTYNILEFVRELRKSVFGPKVFCYFSTDEVYGPAPEGVAFKEWDRYNCTNPYAATKAGAEQLTLSYMNCYKIPGFIVNCMNLFGERQHPEKFIPLCIRKIEAGEEIQIHGTPDGKKSGSRFYIHARNMAAAVNWLFYKYTNREKYNIVGERELTNLEVAQMIADVMGKELKYRIVNFHESRPGHDLRYALDGSKLEQMGYKIPITIENSLRKTVEWTLNNRKWLEM